MALKLSSNDIFKRVMNSQARLELAPPKDEMKEHKLGPRPEAEQQLKTLGNLHTHSAAPSSASTEWLGLQNNPLAYLETIVHYLVTPLFVYKAVKSLTHQETVLKQRRQKTWKYPPIDY